MPCRKLLVANRTDAVERSKANTGRRCDHEILWPPLYTVKWTREYVPIAFFTERRHSEQSALGLTGCYETPIGQAEVRFEWPNSSCLVLCLVRCNNVCQTPSLCGINPASRDWKDEGTDREALKVTTVHNTRPWRCSKIGSTLRVRVDL